MHEINLIEAALEIDIGSNDVSIHSDSVERLFKQLLYFLSFQEVSTLLRPD